VKVRLHVERVVPALIAGFLFRFVRARETDRPAVGRPRELLDAGGHRRHLARRAALRGDDEHLWPRVAGVLRRGEERDLAAVRRPARERHADVLLAGDQLLHPAAGDVDAMERRDVAVLVEIGQGDDDGDGGAVG
jgi:hypothetical protein